MALIYNLYRSIRYIRIRAKVFTLVRSKQVLLKVRMSNLRALVFVVALTIMQTKYLAKTVLPL